MPSSVPCWPTCAASVPFSTKTTRNGVVSRAVRSSVPIAPNGTRPVLTFCRPEPSFCTNGKRHGPKQGSSPQVYRALLSGPCYVQHEFYAEVRLSDDVRQGFRALVVRSSGRGQAFHLPGGSPSGRRPTKRRRRSAARGRPLGRAARARRKRSEWRRRRSRSLTVRPSACRT